MRKPRHSKRALAAGALASLLYAATAATPLGDVTLQWQSTAPLTTNNVWVLLGSPTLATPLTNWVALTNVSGLSTSAVVRIVPGQFHFTVVSSNLWGLSSFSNVASTPPLPASPSSLSISGAH